MSLIMKWAQTTAGLEVLKLAVSEHYFTRKLPPYRIEDSMLCSEPASHLPWQKSQY